MCPKFEQALLVGLLGADGDSSRRKLLTLGNRHEVTWKLAYDPKDRGPRGRRVWQLALRQQQLRKVKVRSRAALLSVSASEFGNLCGAAAMPDSNQCLSRPARGSLGACNLKEGEPLRATCCSLPCASSSCAQ